MMRSKFSAFKFSLIFLTVLATITARPAYSKNLEPGTYKDPIIPDWDNWVAYYIIRDGGGLAEYVFEKGAELSSIDAPVLHATNGSEVKIVGKDESEIKLSGDGDRVVPVKLERSTVDISAPSLNLSIGSTKTAVQVINSSLIFTGGGYTQYYKYRNGHVGGVAIKLEDHSILDFDVKNFYLTSDGVGILGKNIEKLEIDADNLIKIKTETYRPSETEPVEHDGTTGICVNAANVATLTAKNIDVDAHYSGIVLKGVNSGKIATTEKLNIKTYRGKGIDLSGASQNSTFNVNSKVIEIKSGDDSLSLNNISVTVDSESIDLLKNDVDDSWFTTTGFGVSLYNNAALCITSDNMTLNQRAGALEAKSGSSATLNVKKLDVFGNISVDNSTVNVFPGSMVVNNVGSSDNYMKVDNGGVIKIHGSCVKLNPDNVKNNFSLRSSDDSLIDISVDKFVLNGQVKTWDEAVININAKNDADFTGYTELIGENSSINIKFGEDSSGELSRWILTNNSTASSLNIRNSTIDFYTYPNNEEPQFRTLQVDKFTGYNSILKMRVNLENESLGNLKDGSIHSDRLIVNGKAKGHIVADIVFKDPQYYKDLVDQSIAYNPNWMISQGIDSDLHVYNYKGKNEFSGNGMVSLWALSFVPEDEAIENVTPETLQNLVPNNHGEGPGKWYLIYAERDIESVYPPTDIPDREEVTDPPEDIHPDSQPKPEYKPDCEDPSEIQQILNLGVSTMQAMSFASELDDLRARTGEVRNGVSDGAWARASYQKERIFGENSRTFKQETQDLHIGVDHLFRKSEQSSWLFGGALRYAKSDQKGVGQLTSEGDLHQYSAKLYATFLHDSGSYADFVIQAGRYDQELEGVTNDGYSKFSADYKTYGYGLSAEFGHQFALGNGLKSQFNPFIEPQMQLSYFMAKGKDFTTSTGMKISQGDADFLTGRLGVVLGNTFKYGDGANPHFFQIAFTGGMKYEFMGDQIVRFTGVEGLSKTRRADDIDGARLYYGFTSDWKVSDSLRAFAKLEREEGHHYTKDFDFSIGVRYAF